VSKLERTNDIHLSGLSTEQGLIAIDARSIFVVMSNVRLIPSVLGHCWLGGRKGIRPVKTEWWVAGVVICLEQGADLHMA